MTRTILARLLRAGVSRSMLGFSALVLAMLALAACATSSPPATNVQPVAQGAAVSVPARLASPATAGTVDNTSSRYGTAPDSTLPRACLMSVTEVTRLFHVSGLSFKVNNKYQLCQYRNDAVGNFGVVTSMATDFGAAGLPVVSIPPGAPFDLAYEWTSTSDGSVQGAAQLDSHKQWVILAVSDSRMTTDELRQAVKAGLQNIMFWWSKTHSPAPLPAQSETSAPGFSGLVKDATGYNPPLAATCTITHYDPTNGASFTVNFTNPSSRHAGIMTVTVMFQPSGVTYLERVPEVLLPNGNWESAMSLSLNPGASGQLRGGDSEYISSSSAVPTGCRVMEYDAS